MAAISAIILATMQQGQRIVASNRLYGRTVQLFTQELPRFGVTTEYVDANDLAAVQAALKNSPRLLFVETMSNPLLRVVDIPALAEMAHDHGALFVVDNTFATPILNQPMELGADFVMESLTKMIAGHSDVTLGFLGGNDDDMLPAITSAVSIWGLASNPFDCWLAERGLATLELRMQAACANAQAYSRGEDGFGLRPNIGIRGVSPDRSKKITLMEDGVLFAPAPYSAPAAYYFPLITRMESVRVIKGPGAVSFGPQTVGGAIDLVTRRVPVRTEGGIDLGFGQYRSLKQHGYFGAASRRLGLLGEVVNLGSNGWKELDGGGDTGFSRQEAMLKLRYIPIPGARIHNELELKLGFSREDSHETYLGLSDEDFRANPLRRYAASKLDHMEWWRTQLALRHVLDLGGGRSLTTTIYRHDLDRRWNKVNRTSVGEIADVLRAPPGVGSRLALGREALKLAPEASDVQIFIGPNHRDFISQGVQTVGSWQIAGGSVSHRIEAGARLHYDRIDRVHTEDAFVPAGGNLERVPNSTLLTADNREQSNALALHALDALTFRALTLTPGLRFELIRNRFHDRRTADPAAVKWQKILIPGLGGYYALHPALGVLAGIYRGFSPAAPDEDAEVTPETSWNYEVGVRAAGSRGRAEVIGFLNDYQNLSGTCGIGGCAPGQLDRQFNAGRARIWGFEVFGQQAWRPRPGVNLPATLSYTFTRTRFGSTFTSGLVEFGNVQEGYELAYVPRHQAALTVAAETRWVGLDAAASYVSEMRERAGRGPMEAGWATDASAVLEAGARAYLHASTHLYLHVRNLTNAADIASRRPFGARPISPRFIQVGIKARY
jgi:Fe(3+) dicitrate transport protein